MHFATARCSVALICLLLTVALNVRAARAVDDSRYRAVATTVCADFASLKILQDPDVLALYLTKQLEATPKSAKTMSEAIISDLRGANFYCFDLKIQVDYMKGTIGSTP